jgi:alkyl hydroperoxide reductase subunit AhpF
MRVELLYFDRCPSYARLLRRLRKLVAQADAGAEIELRRVDTIEDGERLDAAVLGAGPAGEVGASRLPKLGLRTALVDASHLCCLDPADAERFPTSRIRSP